MCEEYLSPDELAVRRRMQAVQHALKRLCQIRPGVGDPVQLLTRAERLWRRIPSDSLITAVERAAYQFGWPSVTVESVAQAWSQRKRRVKISAAERYRRKMLAEARLEREAATPEESAAFFREVFQQLEGKP